MCSTDSIVVQKKKQRKYIRLIQQITISQGGKNQWKYLQEKSKLCFSSRLRQRCTFHYKKKTVNALRGNVLCQRKKYQSQTKILSRGDFSLNQMQEELFSFFSFFFLFHVLSPLFEGERTLEFGAPIHNTLPYLDPVGKKKKNAKEQVDNIEKNEAMKESFVDFHPIFGDAKSIDRCCIPPYF